MLINMLYTHQALVDQMEAEPISSMRACTATLTEIRYHPHEDFGAEVEFLVRDEWAEELQVGRV